MVFKQKAAQPVRIENPMVIMFNSPDGEVICHLHPPQGYSHAHYGMLVCDLVRHVAGAFKVSEADVWEWVDKERNNPTTEVSQAQ